VFNIGIVKISVLKAHKEEKIISTRKDKTSNFEHYNVYSYFCHRHDALTVSKVFAVVKERN
jgi:hypothetical protein